MLFLLLSYISLSFCSHCLKLLLHYYIIILLHIPFTLQFNVSFLTTPLKLYSAWCLTNPLVLNLMDPSAQQHLTISSACFLWGILFDFHGNAICCFLFFFFKIPSLYPYFPSSFWGSHFPPHLHSIQSLLLFSFYHSPSWLLQSFISVNAYILMIHRSFFFLIQGQLTNFQTHVDIFLLTIHPHVNDP